MTLSLDEVRMTRFHMARRNGYEVTDVDNFVDKVEATMTQMTEEIQMLRDQVDALKSSDGPQQSVEDSGEIERLRAENAALREERPAAQDDSLARENDDLRREIEALRATQAQQAQQLAAQAQAAAEIPEGAARSIVVTTTAEASPAVIQLVQLATEQAEQVRKAAEAESKRLVTEAETTSKQKMEEAERRAREIKIDAQTKAERIESEARVNAERMYKDAEDRANSLDGETTQRRTELFAALETERDDLLGKVGHLRDFETTFRSNLSNQLRAHLDMLDGAQNQPAEVPALVDEQAQQAQQPGDESATPRLDKLLNEE